MRIIKLPIKLVGGLSIFLWGGLEGNVIKFTLSN